MKNKMLEGIAFCAILILTLTAEGWADLLVRIIR